jgi:hypothetical protein
LNVAIAQPADRQLTEIDKPGSRWGALSRDLERGECREAEPCRRRSCDDFSTLRGAHRQVKTRVTE